MTVYSVRKIVRESFLLLSLCILIEILAGQILNSQEEMINIPVLLAAVPLINGVGGNIGSILGARLTSGLHVGYVQPSLRDKAVIKNIFNIILLSIIVFGVLSILMVAVFPATGIPLEISIIKFIGVIFLAGVIMTALVVILGVVSAFISFKRGIDPDNIVTPIITTSGDTIGITIIIVLALLIVL